MRYIIGLSVGVSLGIVGTTVYYVLRALDELDDLDVTPQYSDWEQWAKVINFPTTTTNN